MLTLRNVTEQRKLEHELTHRAFHDSLTGLANRVLFRNRVEGALTGIGLGVSTGHDGRQRVHGRAADEHDQRHQQGKTPTKLVFHKKLILPMKFR